MTSDDTKTCPFCGETIKAAAIKCRFCGEFLPIPEQLPERYDVFLSYSHKDAELYGRETIERIKQEIQNELQNVACRPMVFLDTEALQYGDEWHAKIMEKLKKCQVFICLLSQNYLDSPYCTRERLWWEQKEIRAGRLRKDTLPVYFVQISPDPWQNPSAKVKDLFGFQLEQKDSTLVPWFRGKEKVKELFIKERLDFLKNGVRKKIDARQKSEKSFCSVTPELSKTFVGRLMELKELREICANGHYPVIQADGGVGKTELAIAYVFGYAEEYPMGRFLVHMEGVRNWQDALVSIVNDSQTGRKTREYLGISNEDMKKFREELHLLIARKLLGLAEKGQLLLLLDNVDDSSLFTEKKLLSFSPEGDPIPENLHMIATTRQSLDYPESSRAKKMSIGNLAPDEAFELFCLIGSHQFAFSKRADTGNDPESAALREIIKLLEGHVWSMEIIAGYMRDNYKNGMTFRRKLDELKKNYLISGSGSYRNQDNSIALLKPTLEAVRKQPLGDAVIDLLGYAALLPPDMIYTEVLERCWNEYHGDLEFKDGIPFVYTLNTLESYHLLHGDKEKKKMHRLTQATVKHLIRDNWSEYVAKLASVLEKVVTLSQQDWCNVFQTTPEIYPACSKEFREYKFDLANWKRLVQTSELVQYCPWEKLDGGNWSSLLKKQPQFADRCAWEKLDGSDWEGLLRSRPQFADKCPWEKLYGEDWRWLLREQPQFADKCHWEKLDGEDWRWLLCDQPQFADKCHWEKLDGEDWGELLRSLPQFADKCYWEKLDGGNWRWLLSKQPQFSDKCSWEKLDRWDWCFLLCNQSQFADKCPWEKFDDKNWRLLLRDQPQFADKCPWEKLDGEDWTLLLGKQPQFADKCPWEKLGSWLWVKLLSEQPQFADKCPWEKLLCRNWSELLSNQPQFADKCPWEKLSGTDWALLLSEQPQFADKCPWEKLGDENWNELLSVQPQFADKCQREKHDSWFWVKLLKYHTQFADKCPWKELHGNQWSSLLSTQPQFADKCPWEKLDGSNWGDLLRSQPQFADKCPWEKLDGGNWSWLLISRPQFADKCPWEKLDVSNWGDLLRSQPQFADKCPWEKFDGRDWGELLNKYPRGSDKCPWEKLDGNAWASLLSDQPQFAGKCPWEKLDGRNWSWLLRLQPQFANNCPWEKLDGENWAILLHDQSQFADKCPWEKLGGKDWRWLLCNQPQFADKCSWEKLDGGNWSSLLSSQPQFADKCPWEKFGDEDWEELRSNLAWRFADKCPWEKLDGDDWSWLLRKLPRFAEKCSWEKLDGNNWSELLKDQPQFADKCPPDILKELAKENPEKYGQNADGD